MKHILILEDNPETQQWLRQVVLRAFPDRTVTCAGNIAQAKREALRVPLAIALVDLNLPDGSGADFIGWLKQQYADVYIVVATIYDDDQHLFQALKAGAHGYLLKEDAENQLVEALQAITSGQPPLSSAIARKILRFFQTPPPAVSEPLVEEIEMASDCQLTEREQEVLMFVAKGYSRTEVANFLGITANTAATHVKSIYRKLNICSKVEAVLEAQRLGLI